MSSAARQCEDPKKKAAYEKDVAKVLKTLGYPAVEAVDHPKEAINKVNGCITRRLVTIEQLRCDLKSATKKNDADKGIAITTSDKFSSLIQLCWV